MRIVLIVHVFSLPQTYSHGMFSLLPLPGLLSIRFDQVETATICGIVNPRSLCTAAFSSKTSWKYVPIFKQNRMKHARYSLIIMTIKKYVKRMPICFVRDCICVTLNARHYYSGWGMYCIVSHAAYKPVRPICG